MAWIEVPPPPDKSDDTFYSPAGNWINTKSMQSSFMDPFSQMAKEYYDKTGRKLIINDAWRSTETQAKAYADWKAGRKQAPSVAAPGHSWHEKGLAMDIDSIQANRLADMGLLDKYGFSRPVHGEPWHIQHGAPEAEGGILASIGKMIGPSSAEAAEVPPPSQGFKEVAAPPPGFKEVVPPETPDPPTSVEKKLAGTAADVLGFKLPIIGMSPAQLGAVGAGGAAGLALTGTGAGAVAMAGGAHALEEKGMRELKKFAGRPTEPEAKDQFSQDFAQGALDQYMAMVGGKLTQPVFNQVGKYLKNWAGGLYERVLKVPPTVPAEMRDKAVQTAIEGDYAVTKKGLAKLADDMSVYKEKVGQLVEESADAGGVMDRDKMIQGLARLKSFFSDYPFPEKYMKAITEAQDELMRTQTKRIPVDQAQRMKQRIYQIYEKAYNSKEGVQLIDNEINQSIAEDIMLELERNIPEVKELNKSWSGRINLAKLLERAVNRTRNYETIRMGDMLVGVGSAAGEQSVAGGFWGGLINRVVNNPTVISKLAIMLGKNRGWTGERLGKIVGYTAANQMMEQQPPEKIEPESKRGFTILNQQP